MGWQSMTYDIARAQMQPGDVIAFSGKGTWSDLIKWATRSNVSHVGVILQTKLLIDNSPQAGMLNQVIESATLNGFSGVTINRLSGRLNNYDGEVWWLPLRKDIHTSMDKQAFYDFLLKQDHKPYDYPQAIKAGLDLFKDIAHNLEDFSKFFCSELVSAALEAGKAISHLDASEVTPIDLCSFSIFEPNYYQLKGIPKLIKGFNAMDPTGFGE